MKHLTEEIKKDTTVLVRMHYQFVLTDEALAKLERLKAYLEEYGLNVTLKESNYYGRSYALTCTGKVDLLTAEKMNDDISAMQIHCSIIYGEGKFGLVD